MQLDMKFINFALLKVNFFLNQEFKESEPIATPAPNIFIKHELRQKENQLVVIIGLNQLVGNIPYRFEIEAGGIFQLSNSSVDEKLLKQLATINCPSILFPFVRETLADITRRAGFSPLLLNPVNFIQLAKEHEERLKQQTNN